MSQNPFSSADCRFTNLESATIQVVQFRFSPVQQFLGAVTSVFRTIDFADDYQAEFGFNLWKLRCTVLFSLAPYDHNELELLAQGDQISKMAERLPGSRESTAQMVDRLQALQDQSVNPKHEWAATQDWAGDNPAAVFAMMAMRKSFGSDLIAQLPGDPANLPQIISSLEQIGTGQYSTLVIPGTCQYLSQNLFMKLFHLGEFDRIRVLIYEGEDFRLKDRLRLPESTLLPGCSEGKDLIIERSDVSYTPDDIECDADKLFSDRLFSSPSGEVEEDGRGIKSRFVLCDDGKGFLIAETERIRIWRTSGSERLIQLYPTHLSEGDYVILENSDRSELLDQAGNYNEFSAGLDYTERWRQPLQALLLSLSLTEVAMLMRSTGHMSVHVAAKEDSLNSCASGGETLVDVAEESSRLLRNLSLNISNWAEGRIYGPGDLQHMRALVQVLVEKDVLCLDSSLEEATERWFRDLESLRTGRREAGMHVGNEIDQLLEDKLGRGLPPMDSIEIELANGMVVSLHRLALIGDRISRVPKSSLRKLM